MAQIYKDYREIRIFKDFFLNYPYFGFSQVFPLPEEVRGKNYYVDYALNNSDSKEDIIPYALATIKAQRMPLPSFRRAYNLLRAIKPYREYKYYYFQSTASELDNAVKFNKLINEAPKLYNWIPMAYPDIGIAEIVFDSIVFDTDDEKVYLKGVNATTNLVNNFNVKNLDNATSPDEIASYKAQNSAKFKENNFPNIIQYLPEKEGQISQLFKVFKQDYKDYKYKTLEGIYSNVFTQGSNGKDSYTTWADSGFISCFSLQMIANIANNLTQKNQQNLLKSFATSALPLPYENLLNLEGIWAFDNTSKPRPVDFRERNGFRKPKRVFPLICSVSEYEDLFSWKSAVNAQVERQHKNLYAEEFENNYLYEKRKNELYEQYLIEAEKELEKRRERYEEDCEREYSKALDSGEIIEDTNLAGATFDRNAYIEQCIKEKHDNEPSVESLAEKKVNAQLSAENLALKKIPENNLLLNADNGVLIFKTKDNTYYFSFATERSSEQNATEQIIVHTLNGNNRLIKSELVDYPSNAFIFKEQIPKDSKAKSRGDIVWAIDEKLINKYVKLSPKDKANLYVASLHNVVEFIVFARKVPEWIWTTLNLALSAVSIATTITALATKPFAEVISSLLTSAIETALISSATEAISDFFQFTPNIEIDDVALQHAIRLAKEVQSAARKVRDKLDKEFKGKLGNSLTIPPDGLNHAYSQYGRLEGFYRIYHENEALIGGLASGNTKPKAEDFSQISQVIGQLSEALTPDRKVALYEVNNSLKTAENNAYSVDELLNRINPNISFKSQLSVIENYFDYITYSKHIKRL